MSWAPADGMKSTGLKTEGVKREMRTVGLPLYAFVQFNVASEMFAGCPCQDLTLAFLKENTQKAPPLL